MVAAEAVMAAAAVVTVVEDATLAAAVVAVTDAAATAAEVVITVAAVVVASVSFLVAAAVVAVAAAEVIGAGLMACGPGVLATITVIRPANSLSLLNAPSRCAVRRWLGRGRKVPACQSS
jgi:hypothetical protein